MGPVVCEGVQSWRERAYAWWVVAVLALGLTLSLADRLIMGLMIGPIKHDLHLSDTDISLLQGLAFTFLYVLAGLPLGRVADRGSRRGLAAASVVAWSVMSGACGLSKSFVQLFAARLGVGVGEAGLSPAAVSLVCDYFPSRERARPLAFLSVGATAGAGLALMFGGVMVHAIGASRHLRLPVLGEVSGWQAVFLALGAVGVIFGAIFFTVREPERKERSLHPEAPVSVLVRFLWRRRAYFVPQLLGPSFSVLTLIALHSWVPTLFIRHLHWDAASTGLGYGSCVAVAGIAGILGGGWLAQRGLAHGNPSAPCSVAAWAALAAFIPLVIAPLLDTPVAVLLLLLIGMSFLIVPSALAPAMLQSVCPNEMRGQLFSVYLLVMSSIAYVLGPLSVAWTADHVFRGGRGLPMSLSLICGLGVTAAALCLIAARRRHAALAAPQA